MADIIGTSIENNIKEARDHMELINMCLEESESCIGQADDEAKRNRALVLSGVCMLSTGMIKIFLTGLKNGADFNKTPGEVMVELACVYLERENKLL